ncbi:thioredoxin family protein [Bacteroidales bacterium OttesenSCG-928-J16]|nr:thioredoxin family protein [Bacteroidales bacterium OttesenSCG-928-J16]
MKKNLIYTALSILFVLSGIALSAQTEKKPELLTKETFKEKVWDYTKDTVEFVYLGDKPCMIDFYADWCGWCKKIAPFMEEFAQTRDDMYVYKIDTNQEKELAALFQVRSLPTMFFVPMKGQPTMLKGARSKEEYGKLIDQHLFNKTTPATAE